MKIKILILIAVLSSSSLFAQKQWTLKECIEHAIENNIKVQQSELQIKQGEVRLNTARNSRLPSISANLGGNMSFGRGQSRDGITTDNNQASTSFGASASIPIYEGSRIKNEILANEVSLKSIVQGYERAKEDLSLNIVSLYMQILFNKELLMVTETQLKLSSDFVEKNKVLFENGRVPESDYYESISLMARDKLTNIETGNKLTISLLDLAQALNMPNADGFDILTPEVDGIGIESAILTPADKVYEVAVRNRPGILSAEFLLESYEHDLKVAKSAYYPRISAGGGYNNSYYNAFGSDYVNNSFANQLNLNGSQYVSVSVSIPIFNRMATRNSIRSANISISNQNLAVQEAKLNLQKEIEQSYYNAEASRSNYEASMEAMKAAELAFAYEEQKAASGRSTIFDFNDSKTRLIIAESELVRAKYQYLFNVKILDFYNGIPLTK